MAQQQWVEEFASILAEKLGEAVTQFHRDVGEYWAEEAMIRLLSIYFQFGAECPSSVDEAIKLAMRQGQ